MKGFIQEFLEEDSKRNFWDRISYIGVMSGMCLYSYLAISVLWSVYFTANASPNSFDWIIFMVIGIEGGLIALGICLMSPFAVIWQGYKLVLLPFNR